MPRLPVDLSQVWRMSAFEDSQQGLNNLRKYSRPLSLFTAPAGSGKSFSAEWYAQRHSDVRIARCNPQLVMTPLCLLHEIAEALNCTERHTYKALQYEALQSHLLSHDKVFLIIDEAEQMSSGMLDIVRGLADSTRTPTCLMGCPEVEVHLRRVPATHHRIGFHYEMPKIFAVDLSTNLLGAHSPETLQAIYAATDGNLRHLTRLLELLADDDLRGKTITPTVVKAIAGERLYKAHVSETNRRRQVA